MQCYVELVAVAAEYSHTLYGTFFRNYQTNLAPLIILEVLLSRQCSTEQHIIAEKNIKDIMVFIFISQHIEKIFTDEILHGYKKEDLLKITAVRINLYISKIIL